MVCDRCNIPIQRGNPYYLVRLRLTAGFDGYLPDPGVSDTSEDLLALCDNLDAGSLEAQVDEHLEFKVCPSCRYHIALDPLQRATVSNAPRTLQ